MDYRSCVDATKDSTSPLVFRKLLAHKWGMRVRAYARYGHTEKNSCFNLEKFPVIWRRCLGHIAAGCLDLPDQVRKIQATSCYRAQGTSGVECFHSHMKTNCHR